MLYDLQLKSTRIIGVKQYMSRLYLFERIAIYYHIAYVTGFW